MKCKHENADHLAAGDYRYDSMHELAEPVEKVLCEQFRCLDCGAWLSLGPANDEPEEVQIEIRAAEIAAIGYHVARTSDGEDHGWTSHLLDNTGGYHNEPGHDAGWLAREIATCEDVP